MSRVAKVPVPLPKGVEFKLNDGLAVLKGPKGELSLRVHPSIDIVQEGAALQIRTPGTEKPKGAMSGTTRALLSNMVQGVSQGFQKKLELVGVGYRAQAQGAVLNLTLGFSHPVAYKVPEGITIETPSQTEVVVKGIDRQKSRPGGGGYSSLSPAGALQGQGRAVLG
jgi:large subunit ribosomal protein L6